MRLPERYQGYDEMGFDTFELQHTILSWRGGKDPGKPLCLFNRLANGDNLPAKKVAAHARKIAASIHDTSRFANERPKLEQVAQYADRLANLEEADALLERAARAALAAGMRYHEFHGRFMTLAGEAFS